MVYHKKEVCDSTDIVGQNKAKVGCLFEEGDLEIAKHDVRKDTLDYFRHVAAS